MFEYKGKTYEGAQELLDNYLKIDKEYWKHRDDKDFKEKWEEAWDALYAYWIKLLKDATIGMKGVSEDEYDEVYYGLLDEITVLIEEMFKEDCYTDYEVTYSDIEKSYENRIYYFKDFASDDFVFGIDATYTPYEGIEFDSGVSPTAYVKVPVTTYEYRPIDTMESDEDE